MKTMILLPTYNERENIGQLVPLLFSTVPGVSIMVIDDNSPDGTADAVVSLQTSYPNLHLYRRDQKAGLGRAYVAGFKKVLRDFPEVEVITTMDADLSHDISALPAMLSAVTSADLVIGSRYITGGRLAGWEFSRRLLSRAGNFYYRLLTRMPIHDCSSGYNCIRTEKLRQIDIDSLDGSGYAFLMEFKYALWKRGARIQEYPITFRRRATGESKISWAIIREGLVLTWKLIHKQPAHLPVVCPLCRETSGRFWFQKNNYDHYECDNCQLIFIYPTPDTTRIYSTDYFCGAHGGYGYVNYDHDKQADTKTFERYINEIEERQNQRGRLLDVGAATGVFLEHARRRGWDVAGVEVSEYAAAAGRQKGLDIKTGTLTGAPWPPASFDVVTLWDVFEHIPASHATLDQIHQLLKPNGLLVMNLPDAGSLYARLLGRFWTLVIPPEHVALYRSSNLRRLLTEHHFTWLERKKIGKNFTPAYIFQMMHTVYGHKIWQVISDWLRQTPLNRISIPIPLRDNMFIIARKETATTAPRTI